MNILQYECEYPGCKGDVVKEVGFYDEMLVCASHYNEQKIFKGPLELESEKIKETLEALQRLKCTVNAVKHLIVFVSEELVEKILDSASKLLKEYTEQSNRINRIMNQLVINKSIFPKVLKNIDENLMIPQVSKQNILDDILSSIKNELQYCKNSGIESSVSYKPIVWQGITDVRLLSNQTPVPIKLDLLYKSNFFINQQPLTALESVKELNDSSQILDSPTVLQICLSKRLFITSHNNDKICIWQFTNILNPVKKISLSPDAAKRPNLDTSVKVIDIQQINNNQVLIITNISFHLMNLQNIEIIKNSYHNTGLVQVSRVISNEKVVIGTYSGSLVVFNVDTLELIISKNLYKADGIGPFRALECADRVIAVGGRDGHLKIWYYSEGIINELEAHAGEITAITISKNQHFILTAGDDKYIILWARSIYNFNIVWKKKHSSLVNCLQISFDTRLILLSSKKGLFLSNLSKFLPTQVNLSQIFSLYNHFPEVLTFLKFVPNNK